MKRPVDIILDVFATFLRDKSGTTAIEYTLIASIISIGIFVGAGMIGVSVRDLFTGIATDVKNASNK